MEGGKETRRVRLTKQAIRESFVELMQGTPMPKITVKMICEAADINRSTFYAHYTDPFDLLRHIQMEIVQEFKSQIEGTAFTEDTDRTIPVLIRILQYARENATLFRVLLSENGDATLQTSLVQLAQQKAIEEIQERNRLDPRIAGYMETFAISGFVSIIRKWLDEGCAEDPAQLAEMMCKLLFEGVMSVYP